MDKIKNTIKEFQFENSPERASFDELKDINNKLDKPLKVEMPEKVESTVDFITSFLKSIKGEKGEQGKDGEQGKQGEDGLDGYTPVKGTDYYTEEEENSLIEKIKELVTPIKGKDYFDGKDGQNGKDGKNGTNGENGKDGEDAMVNIELIVTEVLNKIKSLKGNDRIDISAIRNSEQILGKIASQPKGEKLEKLDMSDQRWHGGGITQTGFAGVPENLTSQINGITQVFSTINTLNSILWVSLNGQMIMEDIDFTKTNTNEITLTTIVPAIGEQLFIKYI